MHPGTDGREAAVEQVPAGQELKLGPVVVVGRPHRAEDDELVHTGAEMWPPVTDLGAALPALLEADLKREEGRLALVDDVVSHLLAHVLEERRGQDAGIRALADGLARI